MADEDRMTFVEHLGELRTRLVRAAGAVLVGFFIAWAYRDAVFGFLAAPMRDALAEHGVYNFRSIEITETVFVYLKMCIVAGLIFTLPVSFYQLWAFIAPGLLEKEKQAVAPLLFFSTFFFLLGAFFAYEVIIPFIAHYLAELTLANEMVQMDVTVASAFGFSLKMLLAFGLAFELPLVMFFLALIGIADVAKFVRAFRYFVVVSFIVAAVLTPPDPISQLLMAVPLNALYWVGVGSAWFVGRRREQEGVGARTAPRLGSRIWALLSVALLLLGAGLAAGTWYLGRSDSPLRWIPPGATYVMSVHVPNTLGPDAPDAHRALIRDRLGLPPEAPVADHVIRVGDADGRSLSILAGACANAPPPVGVCAGDDLLLGDEALVDRAQAHEGEVMEGPVIRDLATRAPAWLWHKRPNEGWARVMPGQGAGEEVALAELIVTADLRESEPHVELSLRPKEEGLATAIQNRADLWRAERLRQKEARAQAQEGARLDAELLSLLDGLLALSDARFALVKSGVADREALSKLAEQEAALRARLKARREGRRAREQDVEPPTNLIGLLPDDAVRSWRTAVHEGAASLRVELTPGEGVGAILNLLPENLLPE